MKKLLWLLPCIVLIFIALHQHAQGVQFKKLPVTNFAAQQKTLIPVDTATARKMIKHYKDKDAKKDFNSLVVFDAAEIKDLLNQTGVTDLRLVNAAFLNNHSDSAKRNMSTILICIRRSMGATSITYYTSSKICPPPDSCTPETSF